jgi:hypothetical protein
MIFKFVCAFKLENLGDKKESDIVTEVGPCVASCGKDAAVSFCQRMEYAGDEVWNGNGQADVYVCNIKENSMGSVMKFVVTRAMEAVKGWPEWKQNILGKTETTEKAKMEPPLPPEGVKLLTAHGAHWALRVDSEGKATSSIAGIGATPAEALTNLLAAEKNQPATKMVDDVKKAMKKRNEEGMFQPLSPLPDAPFIMQKYVCFRCPGDKGIILEEFSHDKCARKYVEKIYREYTRIPIIETLDVKDTHTKVQKRFKVYHRMENGKLKYDIDEVQCWTADRNM